MRNYILLSLLLYSAVFSHTSYAHEKQLIFAIDIIRHGDRTPESVIPNDPYPWTEGLGELTALGMKQIYDLGTQFRTIYMEEEQLLPLSYQSGSIYIRSTDYNRTLMSAESLLYGLYPLGTGPTLSDNQTPALPKAFQPIPIHTVSKKDDCLLIPSCSAKKFFTVVEKYVYSSPEWNNKKEEYRDKLKEWSVKTGLDLQRLNQVVGLADNLFICEVHGIPLPPGIDQDESKEIQRLAHWVISSIYKPQAVGQYGSQELLSAIAHYLKNSTLDETKLKYVLFSAHDSTLLSLMSALHNPLSEIPAYASDLKLLLFRVKQSDAYILKITFNGNSVKIPYCKKEDCTFTEFIEFVEKSKPDLK